MRTRKEVEKEFIELNEMLMSSEALRANFKTDVLLEILLDIRDLIQKDGKGKIKENA